ncbi:probable E3 ubiquitin-protein ligase XERICO, partial [Asparagus officinalis]
MGLSSLPTPSEGVLTVLVVNTVMSIAIMKQILNSVLKFLGIRALSPVEPGSEPAAAEDCCEPTLTEQFRSRFKPARFGRRRHVAVDCRVCLARFEAESVVNRLLCGHVFHKGCVE